MSHMGEVPQAHLGALSGNTDPPPTCSENAPRTRLGLLAEERQVVLREGVALLRAAAVELTRQVQVLLLQDDD